MRRRSLKTPKQLSMEYSCALLGRRDYSRFEVEQKLALKGFDQDIIDQTLLRLEELDYLDDLRYSRRFVEYQASRGKGPLKIQSLLFQKKIKPENIELSLAAIDWLDVCKTQVVKQIKSLSSPVSQLETASVLEMQRLYRKLMNSGFYPETINDALQQIKEDMLDLE